MNIAEDALVYRVERTKEATPANAPILISTALLAIVWVKKKVLISSLRIVAQPFRWATSVYTKWLLSSLEIAGNNNPDAKEFTLDIIRDMKRRVEEWSDQYGYHFSIYSTPSESLTDRFCRLDTEKFGSIPDITDKGILHQLFPLRCS